MIQVGIVGGTGYVAGELIRILMHHPEVNIRFVYSHSHAGEEIRSVHEDLFILGEQRFAEDRKSTRLNSSHTDISRMPSSA